MTGRRSQSAALIAPLVILVVALVAAGCASGRQRGGGTEPAATGALTATAAAAAGEELQVLAVSTALWPGENDLLLDLMDAGGQRLAGSGVTAAFAIGAPGEETTRPISTEVVRLAEDSIPLYRARVPLERTGRWTVRAEVEHPDGRRSTGLGFFDVFPDAGTPALGSPVPATDTPTADDVDGRLELITSLPELGDAFYRLSVADALAQGLPFALVIDSMVNRPNQLCGAGLGHMVHLSTEFPQLTMVHAEPYATPAARSTEPGSSAAPGAPAGPLRLAEWSKAWGALEPPWTFIVDGDGRLRAKFFGIVGSDELRSAMAAVSS